MKHLIRRNPQIKLVFALAFSLMAVVLIGLTYPKRTTPYCSTGPLSKYDARTFGSSTVPLDGEDFYKKVEDTTAEVKKSGSDFNIMYLDFREGASVTKTTLSYISPSQNRQIALVDGAFNYYWADYASQVRLFNTADIRKIITPAQATRSALPILNCHKLDTTELNRQVRLNISNTSGKVTWLVNVQDTRLPDPGFNNSYTVEVDAYTGKILGYD